MSATDITIHRGDTMAQTPSADNDRTRAILLEHAEGLHDGYEQEDGSCGWPGCSDAFWAYAQAQQDSGEDDPWALW